ncbi:aminotransferase class I/II-fold pyridoxal phosphate-dependent enzyme [Candidatus Nitrosocosmicus hydrocola]|uniref:aminotransferase class I/II-fold pyridoxal phosphate-dependent enzyme n=1 Tax=Candidatus Nitrosocosmicus hydrocola TaxID=1826872 RepID=UPI000B17FD2E|nr:aminotransferase class I/II-fold pyridoxal phosphate-dependent enzyme [Candidatus Nitrosocosmicus hydrocola]
MSLEDVEKLRIEMKQITNQILGLISQRMEIAKKIGEIKTVLELDIVDDKAELDVKTHVLDNSKNFSLDPEFTGRVVNLLITEAVRIQNNERMKKLVPAVRVTNKAFESMKNNGKRNLPTADPLVQPNTTSRPKIKSHLDVFNFAKILEAQGKNIIHMEVGEPDFPPPVEVRNELNTIYDKGKFHYTQTAGIVELRERLSKYITNFFTVQAKNKLADSLINPNNIIVTPGGRFGIFITLSSLLRPGDEIIVIEPAWPACQDCANYLGVKTRIVKSNLDRDWEPDLDEIENQININTKIICLNYPNNPTGKILSRETLQKIVNLASKSNLYVLSDEVYCNYAYKPFESIINFGYEKAILISSFSKTFAMTGFRVGFAFSLDKNIIEKLTKVQALALTSVAEPMQYCASLALGSDPQIYRQIMKERIDVVCDGLKKLPFEYVVPNGAMYVYARINKELKITDLKLVEALLDNGLAVAPGSGFGSSYSDFIRISTCIETEKIKSGLEVIEKTIGNF